MNMNQGEKLAMQDVKIADQDTTIAALSAKLAMQDVKIADQDAKNEEQDVIINSILVLLKQK